MPSADPRYTQLVASLRQYQQQVVDELVDGTFETRNPVFGHQHFPVGPQDEIQAFDRQQLEDRFIELFGKKELTAVEHRSLAAQSDFLASAEKAFRARHRNRLTTLIYGSGRSHGQVSENGLYQLVLSRLPVLEA